MEKLKRAHPWWPRLELLDRQIAALEQGPRAQRSWKGEQPGQVRISLPERKSRQYDQARERIAAKAQEESRKLEESLSAELRRRLQLRTSEILTPDQRRLQEELLKLQEEAAHKERRIREAYHDRVQKIELHLIALKATQSGGLLVPPEVIKKREELESDLAQAERQLQADLRRIEADRQEQEKIIRKETDQKIAAAIEAAQKRLHEVLVPDNGSFQGEETLSNSFTLPPLQASPLLAPEKWETSKTQAMTGRQDFLWEMKAQRSRLMEVILEDIRLSLGRASSDEGIEIRTGTERLPSHSDVTALVESYLHRSLPSRNPEGGV